MTLSIIYIPSESVNSLPNKNFPQRFNLLPTGLQLKMMEEKTPNGLITLRSSNITKEKTVKVK